MKDLRQSIMIDVKDLMNKNMIEFMKEMKVSLRSNVVESINTQHIINTQINLTPMSQPELITKDSLHPIPQVEALNNLIEEMDIE